MKTQITTDDLPLIIHGTQGAGASFYSVRLIAQFAQQGNKILFYSGFDAAKESFRSQVNGNAILNTIIVKTGAEEDLRTVLQSTTDIKDRIIFIKNVELLSKNIFPFFYSHKNIIISGDIDKCAFKSELLPFPYTSIILFSPLTGFNKTFPRELHTYEGYMWGRHEGIIT